MKKVYLMNIKNRKNLVRNIKQKANQEVNLLKDYKVIVIKKFVLKGDSWKIKILNKNQKFIKNKEQLAENPTVLKEA